MTKIKALLVVALAALLALGATVYLAGKEGIRLTANQSVAINNDDVYFRVFDDSLTHHLDIYMTDKAWLGMGKDMLRFRYTDDRMRTGNYQLAHVTYTDDYGSYALENIGIRTKGNTTRLIPEDHEGVLKRSHFKLKFDFTQDFEPGTDEYKALDKRSFLGLNDLILKSNMTSDRSFVHEKYAYDLLRSLGVPAPKITLVTLTIHLDDRVLDYGVYSMIEPIDKKFLSKTYGTNLDDGNLYKCLWQNYGPATLEPIANPLAVGVKNWEKNYRPAYDLVTNTDKINHKDLYTFIDNLNGLEGKAFVDFAEASLDVDTLLKSFAVTALVGSPDDYRSMGNNYYLYFKPDGQVVFFPYDFDNSLGYGWDGENFGGYEGIATEDVIQWRSLASSFMNQTYDHVLADKILAVPAYRERFYAILEDLINTGAYSFDTFNQLFEWALFTYGDQTANDTSTGQEMFLTKEDWFMTLKVESIKKQLENKR